MATADIMFNNKKQRRNFSDNNEEQRVMIKTIGDKGVFLQEMIKAKVLVPVGFIITSAYQDFMRSTRLFAKVKAILKTYKVSLNNQVSLIQASGEIIKIINRQKFPAKLGENILKEFDKLKTEYVAVRHSLLIDVSTDIFLNNDLTVQMNIGRKDLTEALKRAWSSFFTPAALIFRLKNGKKETDPFSAVLVQKMVEADVSGVCLTVNPLVNDNNQILIEASFGLSEEVNTRGIVRDTYIVDKSGWEILGKTVMSQPKMITRGDVGTEEVEVGEAIRANQKLSDKEIVVLSKLARHLEDFYGGEPQKVEWALEGDKFYVLETRGIE